MLARRVGFALWQEGHRICRWPASKVSHPCVGELTRCAIPLGHVDITLVSTLVKGLVTISAGTVGLSRFGAGRKDLAGKVDITIVSTQVKRQRTIAAGNAGIS